MEVLESHMTERLRLSSCLVNDVCLNSGDLSAPTIRASAATSNSVAFGVAELSAKVAAAKEDVGRFKEDLEWLRWASIRLAEARAQVSSVVDEISGLRSIPKLRPETIPSFQEAVKVPAEKDGKKVSGSGDGGGKTAPQVIQITYPNVHEFDKVPKYMKGRLQYSALKAAIDEINSTLVEKYAFLHAGFGGMKSLASKKKYKALKALESRETKGHYFIIADDLKNCSSFKSEAARRTIFSLLRHVKCVVEIRGPGSIVRYTAARNR